ncbi:type II toxin-antitoxin system RelE/ParE family toxin [Mucilaginibacter sp. RS28]|uniref:Type II toxin-antitoxin system RelE/ParE family toxin n=1 Tax=Mucilaginibacter straminoryzae TaxID=2932774 RepID=A0A9X1WZM8_9SPHI|nr:type II toxin-antitoxin system RelE/ParE family toxin [Mucilaginibacter straminoryzae]MCJ8208464.1 type II toxin-antitoxin system RelE/ParE family toxin [Mucilaginibacter straminoryzae]
MGVKIVYSREALDDIKEIYAFIKKGSVKYAKLEVNYIRSFISKLKHDIYLGKPFPKAGTSVREVIFRNYRIFYDVLSTSDLLILTIHHHARSLSNNPAFKEDDE